MQKKCLPNNFVQLKIIKSCPKRKENPLILCKKKFMSILREVSWSLFSIKYCLIMIFVEPICYSNFILPNNP